MMAPEPSFEDRRDFTDASRGFIAKLEPCIIKNGAGQVVWDLEEFNFMLDQECPPTANPKLWRQGQLNLKQGLYEIVPGICQVRGQEGVIVIDPLISCECAAAALELYQKHRGKGRKVTGMLYSHSHVDHYMGAGGIVPMDREKHDIPIIAPEGFMEAVMSESILAGPAMRQRAAFMYGRGLPRGPEGQVGVGLGMALSLGTQSLISPNKLIQRTGEEILVDGVRIVFQMVPGSEAPAEINFHFPDFKALCLPETATNCLHNIVTLRGAQVRDAKAWSRYLDEAIVLFGENSDVVFGSHNWPTWGRKDLITRIEKQRDLYGYLHDQTVRMMNLGMTGIEIAEKISLPPKLQSEWHCQGFYGSVSHNVKGIYQKYMTWFDGNPAHLWEHTPAAEGARYVECLGGLDNLCIKAEMYIAKNDLRFAATLLGHAVAAFPEHKKCKLLLASTFEQLAYRAENATWRNFYLVGARELRTGSKVPAGGRGPIGPNMSIDQWFDIISVEIDGERAADGEGFVIDFDIADEEMRWRHTVSNGVLHHRRLSSSYEGGDADLEVTLSRLQLLEVLRGREADGIKLKGRAELLGRLLDLTGKVSSFPVLAMNEPNGCC
ncbi:beta-lactamase [Pseudomassariella vexata]|uniref:Beta-lactamase n=1 Tax=Pseudomassariella vexata TaxID=1141098 RepID=A0A1Y2EKS5_9PEZI|nr:beta-lactamase [Pseudomassariella vexata]ORY72129.1 beta-lactamase [Pseudomassariella vexata]